MRLLAAEIWRGTLAACLGVLLALAISACQGRSVEPTPAPATPTATSTVSMFTPPAGSPTPQGTSVPSPTIQPSALSASSPTPAVTATPSPPSRPATPTPTGAPGAAPSAYLGEVRRGGRLGETWSLAEVRYGVHADRVRLVWEMAEPRNHVPFFEAVEVDNDAHPFPTGHDPSWGAARIDLVISDLYPYGFPMRERLPVIPGDGPVTRVGPYPTFSDSHLGFSIGLRTPTAYEVHELTSPVRVVIDVVYGE